jgi:hypothetical protein
MHDGFVALPRKKIRSCFLGIHAQNSITPTRIEAHKVVAWCLLEMDRLLKNVLL